MVAGTAINFVTMMLLCGLALISAFLTIPEIPAALCICVYPCLMYHVANIAGDRFDYRYSLVSAFWIFGWLILVFAIIYWRHGLLVQGDFIEVDPIQAMYFSVTTWTTLGYGDMSPPDRIRHITSVEALLGYIGTGIWIALAGLWIAQRVQLRQEIHQHNSGLVKDHSETNDD